MFLFFSCEQESDTSYSCNRKINEWAIQNIEVIQQMSRNSWLELADSLKIAAFRAFTPNQKYHFWKEKFQEVKDLDWSEEELEHIVKAETFLDNHRFFYSMKLTDDQKDELETFFYLWEKESKQKFGWTKTINIGIAGTGYRLVDIDGKVDADERQMNSTTDCHCNIKMLSDFCNIGGHLGACVKEDCNIGDFGCGWLWLEDCNGICIYTLIYNWYF